MNRKQLNVYADNKLKDLFGSKPCMIGGLVLNNESTFGDYQISKFDRIYTFENMNSCINAYVNTCGSCPQNKIR